MLASRPSQAAAAQMKAQKWRLRPIKQWSSIVPFVESVKLTFDPVDDGIAGVRELWRQTESPKIRAKFPKYNVALELDEALKEPTLEVKYVDGREAEYAVKDMSVSEICGLMYEDSIDMIMEREMQE